MLTLFAQREDTKASHYIRLLDEARCNGDWDAVPELVRKVRKHAPNRSCMLRIGLAEDPPHGFTRGCANWILGLTLTAETEHAVSKAQAPLTPASAASTSTATSTGPTGLSQYIPPLLDAIDKEQRFVEDVFQARVCLGWIHWQLNEPALAAARLPKSVELEFSQLDGTNKDSAGWTKVCAVKASYIKGSAIARTGTAAEALETYESGLPILSSVSTSARQGKELMFWTELFLTGFCTFSSHAIKSKATPLMETEALSGFRAWARFWESQSAAPPGGRAPQSSVPRRIIWRDYYIVLSDLLQQDLPYSTTALSATYPQVSTRHQQRAELKRVEHRYETLLLDEVRFPKADESSEEVEAFVHVVMQNWRVLCGNTWTEQDLGEGGAEPVTRGVQDILYRAATKTFHSTAILRHLFTVHLAVADFDLAFKAFDTYLEIVKKGKSRVEKTGEPELNLDDDETVLKTASECIKALCQYGSRRGAEKAKELGQFFEEWLEMQNTEQRDRNGQPVENGNAPAPKATIAPTILALAWRCIGISHAQWARLTFEASSRSDIQLQAIKCFRKALSPEFESMNDIETLFALGQILAERRELAAAIEVVKSGLLQPKTAPQDGLGPHPGHYMRERSLIPLWHLMALLLSARQDFLMAVRSCEGAFEQFRDPKNLFGDAHLTAYRSDHLNEKATRGLGVVDEMNDSEKQNVLEVKMTQLALIEVLEGPEIAVNATEELLSLYSRLFGDPQSDTLGALPSHNAENFPPKSSSGTLRSIKGSLFGRSNRRSQKSGSIDSEKTALASRPQTSQTISRAPTISITNESGNTAKGHHHMLSRDNHHHEKLQKRSVSLLRKESSSSVQRSNSRARTRDFQARPTTVDGENFFTPPADTENQDQWLSEGRMNQVGLAIPPGSTPGADGPTEDPHNHLTPNSTPQKPIPPQSQQMAHKGPPLKPADPDHAIAQDNRLPHVSPHSSSTTPTPVTRFNKDQEKRRRTSILVNVWLLISGFYRRAKLYEDARGAIEEANSLVQSIETEILRDTSGNLSVDEAGWGGGKSVAKLWADVYSEVIINSRFRDSTNRPAWLSRGGRISSLCGYG